MKKPFALILLAAIATLAFSQPPQSWQGSVMTVKGLISPTSMGITLPHEHLIIVHKYNYLDLTNEADAIEEVGYFKAAGGKTVADASAIGIGRNPAALKRISEATGLNVLMCTGYYKDQWIHDTLKSKSIDQLTGIMIRDIIDGINGIHAGFIKIGISKPITPFEEKAVVAAAHAQLATGVAIELHFDGDRATLAEKNHVLDALENEGVDLGRVIVDHNVPYTYLVNDFISLAQRGCYVAFDMNGLEVRVLFLDERKLTETLNALIDAGYLDHLLLSQDVCFSVCYVKNGGYGYAHLLNNLVPQLKAGGITNEEIKTMMVDNPAHVFPFKVTGLCGNEVMSNETGTVSDNSGDENYLPGLSCQKLIRVKDASKITLHFNSFQTETGYDIVRVYNGETTSSPLLGEYSGNSIPPDVESSGESMLITFTTDGGVEAAGWSATYSSRILKVEPESKEVESSKGTVYFSVKSNLEWWLNEEVNWLTADKVNDSTVAVTFDKNKTLDPRSASIAVGGTGVDEFQITITQAAGDPFLILTPESVTVNANSGNKLFKVVSNINWTSVDNLTWLTASKLNDSILSISYTENRKIEPRRGEITVGDTALISKTVRIDQSAADPVLDIEMHALEVVSDSGSIRLRIISNFSWNVKEKSEYLNPIKENDSVLLIRYLKNPGIDPRTAEIWVGDTTLISFTISLSQNGAVPFLKFDPLSLSLNSDIGMTPVKVFSNMEWSVSENSSWLSAIKTSDTTMMVIYDSNATVDARTAEVVVNGSEFSESFNVMQEGAIINGLLHDPDVSSIRVYPNPFTGKLRFNYPMNAIVRIEIYNSAGVLLIQSDADQTGDTEIDFTGLASGIYMYRIVRSDGKVYGAKVVKR